jgi:hypothetical protein
MSFELVYNNNNCIYLFSFDEELYGYNETSAELLDKFSFLNEEASDYKYTLHSVLVHFGGSGYAFLFSFFIFKKICILVNTFQWWSLFCLHPTQMRWRMVSF